MTLESADNPTSLSVSGKSCQALRNVGLESFGRRAENVQRCAPDSCLRTPDGANFKRASLGLDFIRTGDCAVAAVRPAPLQSGGRMRNLTTRLITTMVMLATVGFLGLAGLSLSIRGLESFTHEQKRETQLLLLTSNYESSILEAEVDFRNYLLNPNAKSLLEYKNAKIRSQQLEKQMLILTANEPIFNQRVRAIKQVIYSDQNNIGAPIMRSVQIGSQSALRQVQQRELGDRKYFGQVRSLFDSLIVQETAAFSQQDRKASNQNNLVLSLAFALAFFGILLLLLLTLAVRRTVTNPIRRLATMVSQLTHGDLSARVEEGGLDEIGDLTRNFNNMAQSLEVEHKELLFTLTTIQELGENSELLHRFGTQLANELSVKNVAVVLLREMGEFSHSEVGAFYIWNESTSEFELVAERALDSSVLARTFKPGVGHAGRAAKERHLIQVSSKESSLSIPSFITNVDTAFEVHLPLLYGQQVVGVVSFGRADKKPYTKSETDMLTEMGEQGAGACLNALGLQHLHEREQELSMLLESTDEGIFGIDIEGHMSFANRAACELTGYSYEELVNPRFHERIHHTTADGDSCSLSNCLFSMAIRYRENLLVSGEIFWRKNGKSFPIEYSSHLIYDGAEIKGAVVTFSDISKRNLANSLLSTQYAVTRVIAEANSIESTLPKLLAAVCQGFNWGLGVSWAPGVGGDLKIVATYAASGYVEALRYLTEHLIGPNEKAFAGRSWSATEVLVNDLEQDPFFPKPPFEFDLRISISVGSEHGHIVEFFSNRNFMLEEKKQVLMAIASQVSQFVFRKRTELHTAQLKDEFVSNVSHELRTPLTAIDGWLDILLDEESDPLTKEQRRFLTTVKRNSDRLMRLVSDLLLISQIGAGKLEVEFNEVDLAQVVRECIELTRVISNSKQITVDLEAGSPTIIRGDRVRLMQLVSNLLSNAIKFTPEHGHIQFALSRKHDSVKLTVRDTGVGIPNKELEHIFDRFFRASTGRDAGGTGLGLAISKAIVDSHNGTILVAETTGPGTTFEVELPSVSPKEQNR